MKKEKYCVLMFDNKGKLKFAGGQCKAKDFKNKKMIEESFKKVYVGG